MMHQIDHPGGMDHADGHRFLIGRKAGQVGFGADGGEGLAIDGTAVPFIVMGHQCAPKWARMSAMERAVRAGAAASVVGKLRV